MCVVKVGDLIFWRKVNSVEPMCALMNRRRPLGVSWFRIRQEPHAQILFGLVPNDRAMGKSNRNALGNLLLR